MHSGALILLIFNLLLIVGVIAGVVYLFVLLCKALRKYINSKDIRQEKNSVKKTLGAILKENRTRNKMTQEFVAESLGVSRQAVSKWENGTSDPSMSNLIALAELYGTSAEEMLKQVKNSREDSQN